MTDTPNIPEEERNDDVYEAFGNLRDALAADEAEEERSAPSKKKNLFKSLRNRRRSKKKKEIEDEELFPVPSVDKDEDIVSHFDDNDADLEEERLAAQYLDEAEELLKEELDDVEDIPEDDDVILDEEGDVPEPLPEISAQSESTSSKVRVSEAIETDADRIRNIALADYADESLVEVDERKAAWVDFKNSRIGWIEWVIIVTVGLVIGGVFIWGGIQTSGGLRFSEPPPTRTPNPNVPIPASIQLPGGWSFSLGKGSLNEEGLWRPYGAEWLQGTEICKWIALPWSTQLEAVVRTLESGDQIQVTMSNYDILTYSIYSRQEVESAQPEELNLDTPSVLVILSSENSEQKWVVTAVLDYEEIE